MLLSFIPPATYWGGWVTFGVSLTILGLMTAFVGDMAKMFGCIVGLKDSVTAITLVALGTSLPDTFASKTAALKDEHADAAIGNITGSNSVNVFLGLGLPWLFASVYHEANGSTYEVPAGDLVTFMQGFSVGVYTLLALFALLWLIVRRFKFGGELGGAVFVKWLTGAMFVLLWLLYIVLSSMKAYEDF